MSAHTPGPWRVGRKVGRTVYAEEAGTEGRLIGVMDRREDAQLAAAAPDLLQALHRLMACEPGPSLVPYELSWNAAMEQARAAIAKAEGK